MLKLQTSMGIYFPLSHSLPLSRSALSFSLALSLALSLFARTHILTHSRSQGIQFESPSSAGGDLPP